MPSLINVGFVGLSKSGWASNALAAPLIKTGKYKIVAVSTSRAESAAASAEAQSAAGGGHTVKPYHGDTSQIANDPDVQLVAVSVRAPEHQAAALPAIEAGKDLFIEWPAGHNLEVTKELWAKAKAKGIRTIVGLQGRQNPVVLKVGTSFFYFDPL
jgi:predicted dehydrogenase